MYKRLISLFLASAILPAAAYAQDNDNDRGQRAKAERSERASQRGNAREVRAERSGHVERAERAAPRERAQQVERADRQADRSPRDDQSGEQQRAARPDRMERRERPVRAERPARTDRTDRVTEPIEQAQAPAVVQPLQQGADRPDGLVDGFREVARDIKAGRDRDHDGDHDWSGDWRKDKRYDWWKYRNHHRSLFRLGRYYDPYGWGYRRWSIGLSLWPSYYGSSFWLDDPWMYRLPPAYGPYRWVRYYDDALLVNIYTGHVVDVVYNFFW